MWLSRFSQSEGVLGVHLLPSLISVQTASVHHHLERNDLKRFLGIVRSNRAKANRNTHVNERMFRRMRGRKTVMIELPDDVEERRLQTLSPAQLRFEMLKKGVNPYREVSPRIWQEAQITMQSFNAVIDPYVSNEDPLPWNNPGGVIDGFKAKGEELKERGLHRWHNWRNGVSRIRKKEGFEKFDIKTFGPTADSIYEEAHKALMARDKKALHNYITEHAFTKMWPDVENGSIQWELVSRVEPSRVVAVRCADNPYKSGNDIAQITVRMHLYQKLAMFDRFGHLLLGSPSEVKQSIEYVVLENHIAVVDGMWRLHDKVYPRWLPPKQGTVNTQALEQSGEEERPLAPAPLMLRADALQKERMKKDEADR